MNFTTTFSVNFRCSSVLEVNEVDVDIVLQECFIELQSDITAQARFKYGKQHFWISSEIWEKAKLMFYQISYFICC
jgi:hypothetical protein